MPVVHRRINEVDMPKKQDPVAASPERYCICRSSRADGFMICCDKCNVWFHGDCISLEEDVGLQYDVYYCDKCRLMNRRLKCTYKSQPTTKTTEPEPAASKAAQPDASKPSSLLTRRKSLSALRCVREGATGAADPVKLRAGFLDNSPKDRKNDEKAAPVPSKSVESKASQCNLNPNPTERTAGNPSLPSSTRSMKRRICRTNRCDDTARPDSRYCSDECGSINAWSRIFAAMPFMFPTWGLSSDRARADAMMALVKGQPCGVLEPESENEAESEKSSQLAASEKKIVNGATNKNFERVLETEENTPSSHKINKKSSAKERYFRSRSRSPHLSEKSDRDKGPSRPHTPKKVSSLTKTQTRDKNFKTPCSSPKSVSTPRRESKDHANQSARMEVQKCGAPPKNTSQQKTQAEPNTLETSDTKAALPRKVNPSKMKSNYDTRNKRNFIGRSNLCFNKELIKDPILCDPKESRQNKLKALSQIVSKLLPEQKDYLVKRRKAMEAQRVSTKETVNEQRACKATSLKD
ncbi:CXXC-type zinc finger protein 1 isoform X2 [Drosophila bipectinata]|uniref:CXXC-type zinc finger protein 1 isoform X2 n=1 Tax=Drosophila bipectinata TaxID=42026 RepID=UPI0038B363F9